MQGQEDRGQHGAFAQRKEFPPGWNAESQMIIWRGEAGRISQAQIMKFPV